MTTTSHAASGAIFYVGNSTTILAPGAVGGSNGNSGATPQQPFSTIAYALTQCTAGRGDVIYVLPSHAESVPTADLTLNVTGVSIVGLGRGAFRPTLNLTATGSTIAISAASTSIENLLITGGIDAIVAVLTISAADVLIKDIEYRDVTGQCTDGILTTAAADRLTIDNLFWNGATAAGTNAAIALVGGDGIVITNSKFDGDFAVGVIDVRTTATTDLEVNNCHARTRNAACVFIVDTQTGSTGFVGPNIYFRLLTDGANGLASLNGATFVFIDPIYIVNAANEKGLLTNKTASGL